MSRPAGGGCRPSACRSPAARRLSGKIGRGPSMYEMEGPQPGRTAASRADCSPHLAPSGLPPVPGTRAKRRFPGPSRVPGLPPGRYPSPVVRAVLRPPPRAAQEVPVTGSKILWPSTVHPQNASSSPQRRALVHRLIHRTVHRGVVLTRVPAGSWPDIRSAAGGAGQIPWSVTGRDRWRPAGSPAAAAARASAVPGQAAVSSARSEPGSPGRRSGPAPSAGRR
jgi:hypothetical protein